MMSRSEEAEGSGFCDDSFQALLQKRVPMEEGACKLSSIA